MALVAPFDWLPLAGETHVSRRRAIVAGRLGKTKKADRQM